MGKQYKFILPTLYTIVLIIDIGFDFSDYQILSMLISPPAWFNYFQHGHRMGFAIIMSIIIWFLVGFGIDRWRNES